MSTNDHPIENAQIVSQEKVKLNAQSTEAKPELTAEQRGKLERQNRLYTHIQQGGLFLRFIHNDLERQKREHFNRAGRRRLERELSKGVFSRELIETYYPKLEEITDYIQTELGLKNTATPEPVDGADYLAKLREQEANGTLPKA